MIQIITIGPVTLHIYGLIIGLALVISWWWIERMLGQETKKNDWFEKVAIVTILGGIIGARLYHVIDYWAYYRTHQWSMVAVWQGGLGIWGALMGGGIGLGLGIWGWRLGKKKALLLIDALALGLPLGQAIGRWGNFVNDELFGKPTTLPWGIWISPQYRPLEYVDHAYYQPLFAYESILCLGLFIGLHNLHRHKYPLGTGALMGWYFIGYGMIRFGLEPLRITMWRIGTLPVAQLFAVVAILGGILICLQARDKHET